MGPAKCDGFLLLPLLQLANQSDWLQEQGVADRLPCRGEAGLGSVPSSLYSLVLARSAIAETV